MGCDLPMSSLEGPYDYFNVGRLFAGSCKIRPGSTIVFFLEAHRVSAQLYTYPEEERFQEK